MPLVGSSRRFSSRRKELLPEPLAPTKAQQFSAMDRERNFADDPNLAHTPSQALSSQDHSVLRGAWRGVHQSRCP